MMINLPIHIHAVRDVMIRIASGVFHLRCAAKCAYTEAPTIDVGNKNALATKMHEEKARLHPAEPHRLLQALRQ